MLISRKIADYVPSMEKIISMLQRAGDIPTSHFTTVYDVICRDFPRCRQAAIQILQAGLQKYPNSPVSFIQSIGIWINTIDTC